MRLGVAVIPAKGSSTALPRKNLQTVGGTSLLERTIRQAQSAKHIHQIFVVTEDDEISDISAKQGATVYRCTAEMSDNTTMVWDKVKMVADTFKDCRGGLEPYFAELHPTYPFRTPKLIDNAISMMLDTESDGLLIGSCLYDRVWRCADGFERVASEIEIRPRQLQDPLYLDHYGLCNVFSLRLAVRGNPYAGKLHLHICNDKRQLIDIDDSNDLEMCRSIAIPSRRTVLW